jgi:hypothetical protein
MGLHGLLQGQLYLYIRAEQQALALLRHKKQIGIYENYTTHKTELFAVRAAGASD